MLNVVIDLLHDENELCSSIYKVKKILIHFGMKYKKIHTCPNDYILYIMEYVDLSSYPICGDSRRKMTTNRNVKKVMPT